MYFYKYEETQSTNATNNYGAVCKPGSECLVISYCNTIDFSPETRLPCGSEKGGTLLACCPVRKASSLKQTMETSTTGSTASPSATTIAPITTASNINDVNSNLFTKYLIIMSKYQHNYSYLFYVK